MAKKVWYGKVIESRRGAVHILKDTRPQALDNYTKNYACGLRAILSDSFTREVPKGYRICGNCLRTK